MSSTSEFIRTGQNIYEIASHPITLQEKEDQAATFLNRSTLSGNGEGVLFNGSPLKQQLMQFYKDNSVDEKSFDQYINESNNFISLLRGFLKSEKLDEQLSTFLMDTLNSQSIDNAGPQVTMAYMSGKGYNPDAPKQTLRFVFDKKKTDEIDVSLSLHYTEATDLSDSSEKKQIDLKTVSNFHIHVPKEGQKTVLAQYVVSGKDTEQAKNVIDEIAKVEVEETITHKINSFTKTVSTVLSGIAKIFKPVSRIFFASEKDDRANRNADAVVVSKGKDGEVVLVPRSKSEPTIAKASSVSTSRMPRSKSEPTISVSKNMYSQFAHGKNETVQPISEVKSYVTGFTS